MSYAKKCSSSAIEIRRAELTQTLMTSLSEPTKSRSCDRRQHYRQHHEFIAPRRPSATCLRTACRCLCRVSVSRGGHRTMSPGLLKPPNPNHRLQTQPSNMQPPHHAERRRWQKRQRANWLSLRRKSSWVGVGICLLVFGAALRWFSLSMAWLDPVYFYHPYGPPEQLAVGSVKWFRCIGEHVEGAECGYIV
jgi:hypothetical protein